MELAIEKKWEGKVSAKLRLRGCSGEHIWPLLEDFFSIGKWHPSLTCQRTEGISGQPGCIRYCAMTSMSHSADGSDGEIKLEGWAYEKLMDIDRIEKCFGYEFLENNLGYNSYLATWKVVDLEEGEGCEVIWSFVANPVEGQTLEEMVSFSGSMLQIIAKGVEEDVKSNFNKN